MIAFTAFRSLQEPNPSELGTIHLYFTIQFSVNEQNLLWMCLSVQISLFFAYLNVDIANPVIFSAVCTTVSKHNSVCNSLAKTQISVIGHWIVAYRNRRSISFFFFSFFFFIYIFICILGFYPCCSLSGSVVVKVI